MLEYMFEYISKHWISLLSLAISLFTFVMNYWKKRPHLRIKDKNFHEPSLTTDELDEYNFLISCKIDNRSENPITITNVKLNGKNCFPSKVNLAGCDITYLNQQINVEQISSYQFPIKINPYDTEIGALFFKSTNPIKLRKINILKIYTSRGKKIRFFFNFKKVNKQLQQL